MLTPSKKTALLNNLKAYSKKYLHGKFSELDESGTRLMINDFLTNVLGYVPIEEVKTEFMIKGTYADYVIQMKGKREFLVEVKSLSLTLSEKHLRQAVNYGANEGIDWALLTNGSQFDLYKILFTKPIDAKKVFSLDISDLGVLKNAVEYVQYLHRDSVLNKGLNLLWNKNCALDPHNIAGLLYTPSVVNTIRKALTEKFKVKFDESEIQSAYTRIITEPLDFSKVKPAKGGKPKLKVSDKNPNEPSLTILEPKSEETKDDPSC